MGGTVADVPAPHSGRPLYQQVAEALRAQIKSGALPPGYLLPTEAELMRQHDVARGTVRQALEELRREGLVVTDRGGSRVRPEPAARRVANRRYRRPETMEASTPFTRDRNTPWPEYELEREFFVEGAPERVAALFGVPAGTPVLRREFTFVVSRLVHQVSTSYLLHDMVADTPVADPANEPWTGGTVAQLHSVGVTVTRVVEQVGARLATREEHRRLRLDLGGPVLTISRQMFAGPKVVEVAADIVVPADRTVLEYELLVD